MKEYLVEYLFSLHAILSGIVLAGTYIRKMNLKELNSSTDKKCRISEYLNKERKLQIEK
jgi:hypothetical protein